MAFLNELYRYVQSDGGPHGDVLDEDELAEVIRKPSIGLYKGYAEF